ncbi:hypothetical protein [Halobacillus sp. Marseille-Q1614]|uniref:hypothetical protein n=1 Tax=Halobacillus sp. Marseille-Q1614 TaxID=2709134 RepID=UPI001570FE87|nr:hypothetical protein [Halobacillus sp. Marseille-Q1614]
MINGFIVLAVIIGLPWLIVFIRDKTGWSRSRFYGDDINKGAKPLNETRAQKEAKRAVDLENTRGNNYFGGGW